MTEILPLQTYSAQPSQIRPTDAVGNVFGVVSRSLLRRAVQAWLRRRDEKVLQTLTDHQLRDIGISRWEISRAAREGWGR